MPGVRIRRQSAQSSSEAQATTRNGVGLKLRCNAAATADLPLPASPMIRIGSFELRLARAGASHRAVDLNGLQSSVRAVWPAAATTERPRRLLRRTTSAPTG